MDEVGFPAYVIDAQGRIQAMNGAAKELVGDQRGRLAASIVAPQEVDEARRRIARKLLKPDRTDAVVTLKDESGNLTRAEISSVSLLDDGGHIVGIFGLMRPVDTTPAREHPGYHLTPRQREILAHLVQGHSTDQIAAALGIAPDTVRNHVRGLLRALDVHSRLEAVAVAMRDGLVVN
jgi:DNA-binding CsgD family transcriptional regulator